VLYHTHFLAATTGAHKLKQRAGHAQAAPPGVFLAMVFAFDLWHSQRAKSDGWRPLLTLALGGSGIWQTCGGRCRLYSWTRSQAPSQSTSVPLPQTDIGGATKPGAGAGRFHRGQLR
jgi:hypothetical protein